MSGAGLAEPPAPAPAPAEPSADDIPTDEAVAFIADFEGATATS